MSDPRYGKVDPDSILFPVSEDPNTDDTEFEVIEQIGHGGMGAVYKAVQLKLNRTIALKVLPAQEESEAEEFTQRFQQEARTLAALDHPNIVTVYDFGVSDEGLNYLAMEFVEGCDLISILRSTDDYLEEEWVLACADRVCDALTYAHSMGVIHRDIKPNNVLVSTTGEVKVVDFGLAKILNPGEEQSPLTMSGVGMGTLDYAAPEQMVESAEADHRVDIYSLGATLYQLLTRKLPRGAFFPPSVENPSLNPKIDEIILKAMAEDREERYQTVEEMRQALNQLRLQETGPVMIIGAPPAKTESSRSEIVREELARKKALRRKKKIRKRIAVALVLVLVLAGGGGHYLYQEHVSSGKNVAYSFEIGGEDAGIPAGLFPLARDAGDGPMELRLLARDGSSDPQASGGIGDLPPNREEIVALAQNSVGFSSEGPRHGLAIRADGSLLAWGDDSKGQATVPPGLGPAVEAAVGDGFSVVLLEDGTVVSWGDPAVSPVPESLPAAISISAGLRHAAAVLGNGAVAIWGDNSLGQLEIPDGLGRIAAVSCGDNHTLVLSEDGRIAAWGDNSSRQSDIPGHLRRVEAICAVADGSWGLGRDGSLVGWGDARRPPSAGPVPRQLGRFVRNGRLDPGAVLLAGGWPTGNDAFALADAGEGIRLLENAGSFLAGSHQLIALVPPGGKEPEAIDLASAEALPDEDPEPAPPLPIEPETPDEPVEKPAQPDASGTEGTGPKPGALLLAGERFETEEAAFRDRLQEQATGPLRKSLDDLNAKYLANLEKNHGAAVASGDTKETEQFEAEILRVEGRRPAPGKKPDALSQSVRRLRKIYLAEIERFRKTYQTRARKLVSDFDANLAKLQETLIQEQKLTEALAVRDFRPTLEARYVQVPINPIFQRSGSVEGRYVRIQLEGENRTLALAEVEVYSGGLNLALQGMAEQSSDAGEEWDAGRSIDGNTSHEKEDASSSKTKASPDPWWQLDLGSTRDLDAVTVHSRKGEHSQLKDFRILVLDEEEKPVLKSAPLPGVEAPVTLLLSGKGKALAKVAGMPSSKRMKLFFPDEAEANIEFTETEKITGMESESIARPYFGRSFENTAGITMLGVEPGSFLMGDHSNGPRQVVLTHGFWLGKHEVTREQWLEQMGELYISFLEENTIPKGDDYPILHLWPEQIHEFCRRLTEDESKRKLIPEGYEYRVPTAAEWEYACRAGTTGPIYGEAWDEIAWPPVDPSRGALANPVGKKKANPWGFFDMLGNAPELVLDPPGETTRDLAFNPVGGYSMLGSDMGGLVIYLVAGTGEKAWDRYWADTPYLEDFFLEDTYNGGPLGFRIALVSPESKRPDLAALLPRIEDQVSGGKWDEALALVDRIEKQARDNALPDVTIGASLVRELVALAQRNYQPEYSPVNSRERIETGNRYLFVPIHLNWEEADTFARSFGAHLVTIESREEMDFLLKELPEARGICWLGANGRRSWNWCTKEEWKFENWARNQPDNKQEWSRRFAVTMNFGPDGAWHDVPEIRRLPCVLEWESK